jgi:hypothetical protein
MERISLSSDGLDFWVDVCIFTHRGRWLAAALVAGDSELGLGTSRDEAIRRALSTLGTDATTSLMGGKLSR